MKIEELEFLRSVFNDDMAKSYIKEDKDKINSFVKFVDIIWDKGIFTNEELKMFAIKYRDSIYGETFLDMLCVLHASEVKFSPEEYKLIYWDYMMARTSDEEDYIKLLKNTRKRYGDCSGFFNDELFDRKIVKEKEKHFSISVQEYLNKGGNISLIKGILEENEKEEFDMNTLIYINK